MPWMRCSPALRPVRIVGDSSGSSGYTRMAGLRSKEPAHAHDRAAGADAGDERVGRQPERRS